MELASAAAIPLINVGSWLIGLLVACKVAEDGPKIAKILLDKEEAEEYNRLSQEQREFERRKHDEREHKKPQHQSSQTHSST